MRWTSGDRSNIEDRRGMSGMGVGGLGVGGLLVVLLLSWFTGVDFLSLIGGGDASAPTGSVGTTGHVSASPEEERLVEMVDAVMGDAQETWEDILNGRYQRTVTVLFRDATQSPCGFAQAATGPFYCPADRKVYLDLGFFDELHRRLGAPGDFAQAYVLAHEVGHHVQTVLGIESQVRRRQAADASARNALSVRMELQADCFAGVWGHHANRGGSRVQLEEGDFQEGMNAAAAIGDDRLQRMQGGHVAPDRFTHGTSEQRAEWLRRGFQSGDPNQCNTFNP